MNGFECYSAEQRLWFAVLNRAINDLTHKRADIRNEAFDWFDNNFDDIRSFLNVCHILNLNPVKVRKYILDNIGNVDLRELLCLT